MVQMRQRNKLNSHCNDECGVTVNFPTPSSIRGLPHQDYKVSDGLHRSRMYIKQIFGTSTFTYLPSEEPCSRVEEEIRMQPFRGPLILWCNFLLATRVST